MLRKCLSNTSVNDRKSCQGNRLQSAGWRRVFSNWKYKSWRPAVLYNDVRSRQLPVTEQYIKSRAEAWHELEWIMFDVLYTESFWLSFLVIWIYNTHTTRLPPVFCSWFRGKYCTFSQLHFFLTLSLLGTLCKYSGSTLGVSTSWHFMPEGHNSIRKWLSMHLFMHQN